MQLIPNEMTPSESALTIISETLPSIQLLVKDLAANKTEIEITKLNKILSLLANQLQNSKEKTDRAFLASDEGKEILIRIMKMGIMENNPEKSQLCLLFLTNFINEKFSADTNKLQVITAFEKINSLQAGILRDATEWLVLAYGRDIVKQSTDYIPENREQPYVGFIMEFIVAIFARITIEKVVPQLDFLVDIEVFAIANNGEAIQHFGQTGRGFKPTKLGIQLLEYLGIALSGMPEKNNFKTT